MANRSKLIKLFVGSISNAVLHEILKNAIEDSEVYDKYIKEVENSWEIAKKYREKINPISSALPIKDTENIKKSIINKVRAELLVRISKGYENINLGSVEESVDKILKEMKVT